MHFKRNARRKNELSGNAKRKRKQPKPDIEPETTQSGKIARLPHDANEGGDFIIFMLQLNLVC